MADSSRHQVDDLETRARKRFGELSQAELALLRAAPRGEVAWCGPSRKEDDPANDPANADQWGPERQIRAELIRWLCVDREAASGVDPMGIRVHGARITGPLNLSFASVPFPLGFWRCRLTDDADLTSAQLPALNLAGSLVQSIAADGTSVRGSVSLRDGFRAEGGVRLLGAQIGGDLYCCDGTFNTPGEDALNACRANVNGSVFLCDRFRAEGAVSLLGARIGGDLDCVGGTFNNPGEDALSANRVSVQGSVHLRDGFRADGEVRLLGAQIGGDLDCVGGTFNNPGEDALSTDRVNVEGGVFLHEGFRAEGAVRLLGAQIGGGLDCSNGTFNNPGEDALSANRVNVQGSVHLRDGFRAEGAVRLLGARIGGDLYCVGGTFNNPGEDALSANRVNVQGSIHLGDGFRAEGDVGLPGAQIGGDLDCSNGTFNNPGEDALSADGASVQGSVFLGDGFRAESEVRLLGVQIGGNLDCSNGTFNNAGKDALTAEGANVKGNVFLSDRFEAEGQVGLVGVQIGGDLDCAGGTFNNPFRGGLPESGKALSADGVNVKGDVFLGDGFRAQGAVRLVGAEIAGNLECRRGTFEEVAAEGATIRGMLFWHDVVVAETTELDLKNASAGSLVDDEASWPAQGKLSLDGFVYERISGGPTDAQSRLRWLQRQSSFTPQPYRQVAKVLREPGDDRGARRVLFEMEHRRRQEEDGSLPPRLWSWMLRVTVGYGFYPGRAIWNFPLLILLGCVLFCLGYLRGAMTPTDEDAYHVFQTTGQPPAYYPRFSPLIYSLENSVPVIDLGHKDYWRPDPSPQPSTGTPALGSGLPARIVNAKVFGVRPLARLPGPGPLRWFRWGQVLLGWLLAILLGADVGGVVRKG